MRLTNWCFFALSFAWTAGSCGHYSPPLPALSEVDPLSGWWSYGTGPEPPPGPRHDCSPGSYIDLYQKGQALTGTAYVCSGPCGLVSSLRGTVVDARVHLEGHRPDATPAHLIYELSWNPGTQHLTGTRNGEPFWAVRYVKDESAHCQGRIY
jgi:hypothetical protein